MYVQKLADRNYRLTSLSDYSDVWVDFLQRSPKVMKGMGFSMRVVGGTGSAKTYYSCQNMTILEKANQQFYTAFYKPPDGAIDLIEKFVIPELKGKFEPFERYGRLGNNAWVLYDEGAILANAKRAFETEMLDLEENAAVPRHHNWIININCQDDGIIKKFREKAPLTLWKRVGKNYTKYQHDPFIKEYQNDLIKLKRGCAYFENALSHFSYTIEEDKAIWAEEGTPIEEGQFNFAFKKYCPWWNEEISMMWGSTNLSEQRQRRKHKMWLENAVRLQKSWSGKELKNLRDYAIAFFMMEDMKNHTGEFAYIEPEIGHICSLAKHLDNVAETDELTTILKELGIIVPEQLETPSSSHPPLSPKTKESNLSIPIPVAYEDMAFPDYVKLGLWGTTKQEHEWAEMVRQFLEGVPQGDIQNFFGGTMGIINNNLYQFRIGAMGYWFERWVNYILKTGYESPQNGDKPDCIVNEYAISCKCIVTTAKTITFYQNAEMDEQSKCKRLRPEYLYSIQRNHQPYWLIEYNPWWRSHPITYRMIDPDEDDRIVFGPGQPECSDWNVKTFRKEIGLDDDDFEDATTDENWELTVEPSIPDQEID